MTRRDVKAVMFVDARQWPDGKQTHLNGQPRTGLLNLDNAMKADQVLQPYP